jgi:hypothetical protein
MEYDLFLAIFRGQELPTPVNSSYYSNNMKESIKEKLFIMLEGCHRAQACIELGYL